MAAAAKVGELLDVYGLSMSEVELREEACVQRRAAFTGPARTALRWLYPALLRFCECRGWTDGRQDFVLFGLEPDAQMAEWLLHVIARALAHEECALPRQPRLRGAAGSAAGRAALLPLRLRRPPLEAAGRTGRRARRRDGRAPRRRRAGAAPPPRWCSPRSASWRRPSAASASASARPTAPPRCATAAPSAAARRRAGAWAWSGRSAPGRARAASGGGAEADSVCAGRPGGSPSGCKARRDAPW